MRASRQSTRRETRAAGREDQTRTSRELAQRLDDLLPLVRDDAALDRVAVSAQELVQEIAAAVLSLTARDTVGDGQHGGLQTSSFIFSIRRTSLIVIALSTALHMS